MSRPLQLALMPLRSLLRPFVRAVRRRIAAQIDASLAPAREELRTISDEMKRELWASFEVMRREQAASSELLRASGDDLRARLVGVDDALGRIAAAHESIRSDCDLIRELNPMFNSFLRDLMRLQAEVEELAYRLERREGPDAGRAFDVRPGRESA